MGGFPVSSLSTTALVSSGKAVALSVAFGMVLAFVPFLSIIAVPALPIPVAYIATKHGMPAGLLAGLMVGAACVALTGLIAGLLVLLLVLVVGVGTGMGLRRGVSQKGLFVAVMVFFMLALSLWSAALLLSTGLGPVSAVEDLTDKALVPARDFYVALGMGEEDAEAAAGQAREFASLLPYLMPAVLLVLSLTLSGATMAMARKVFERFSQPFPRGYEFRNLRLHFSLAYVMITGLLCELAAPYISGAYGTAVGIAGMNLLIVSETLFFVQGLAIAHFFLGRYRVSRPKRTVVYVCLILLQVTLSLTSWLGLFDTWVDYRRRFGRKKPKGQAG